MSVAGQKLAAETLSLALATYVTNSTLAGSVATSYGFGVSTSGLAIATFNVGADGAAFGVADNSVLSIIDLLNLTNARTTNGVLWDIDGTGTLSANETILANMAYLLFDSINNT